MQVCTTLQTDNHSITSPLIFLQAGCFLLPNQQHQSTEGILKECSGKTLKKFKD